MPELPELPQDLVSACLAAESAHPYFPAGTLHVVVVDPGVGTRRTVLWVRTDAAAFLAPDNGVLSFLAPDRIREMRRVENRDLMLPFVSMVRRLSARRNRNKTHGEVIGALSRSNQPLN